MKRLVLFLALIIVAAAAVAQTAGGQQNPPAQAGASKATPAQQPAAAPPPPPPQLPGTRRPPEAKTQEELKAFQEIYQRKTGPELETGAGEFAQKFPDSQLTLLLYRSAMMTYDSANSADKSIEMGRKLLSLDPNNPEALMIVGSNLAQHTRDTDLDRDERLAEAQRSLEKALQTLDTDLMLPVNMPPEQGTAIRTAMRAQVYGALGVVQLAKKDYAAAEKFLQQATQLAGTDPALWLRLAYVLDKEEKYKEALGPAQSCIQFSAEEPQINTLCKQELARLNQLAAAPPKPAAPPTAPQPQTSVPK